MSRPSKRLRACRPTELEDAVMAVVMPKSEQMYERLFERPKCPWERVYLWGLKARETRCVDLPQPCYKITTRTHLDALTRAWIDRALLGLRESDHTQEMLTALECPVASVMIYTRFFDVAAPHLVTLCEAFLQDALSDRTHIHPEYLDLIEPEVCRWTARRDFVANEGPMSYHGMIQHVDENDLFEWDLAFHAHSHNLI